MINLLWCKMVKINAIIFGLIHFEAWNPSNWQTCKPSVNTFKWFPRNVLEYKKILSNSKLEGKNLDGIY